MNAAPVAQEVKEQKAAHIVLDAEQSAIYGVSKFDDLDSS